MEGFFLVEDIKLTSSQKELLHKLVFTGHNKKLSTEFLSDSEKKKIIPRIERLRDKFSKSGVILKENPETQEFWFNYSDLRQAGFKKYIEPEKTKDTAVMYISPGHQGIGTKLYNPLISKGINVFLKHNHPIINSQKISEEPLISSLDAVIMVGGLRPDIPRNTGTKTSDKKGAILSQIPETMMSEERKKEEHARLEQLIESELISETTVKRYRDEVYGIIKSRSDADLYAQKTIKTMFDGLRGTLIYQPGTSDLNIELAIRKELKEDVKQKINQINKYRNEIKHLDEQIATHKEKIIVDGTVYNYIKDLEDSIPKFDLDFISKYPNTSDGRNLFKEYYEPYVNEVISDFKKGDLSWDESQFKGLTDSEIEDYKRRFKGLTQQKILASLSIIVTYRGLIWQYKRAERSKEMSEGRIDYASIRKNDVANDVDKTIDDLALLGWVGEKQVKESDFADDRLFKLRSEEILHENYSKIAGDLDLLVLREGVSHLNLNGFSFEVEYTPEDPKGDSKIDDILKRVSERGMVYDFVPDVALVGPSSKFKLVQERKHVELLADAPNLTYGKDKEPITIAQLSHLYSSDLIKQFRENTADEKRDSKVPKHMSSGCILVHTLAKDRTVEHVDIIPVEALQNLALNELRIETIYDKLRRVKNSDSRLSLRKELGILERKRVYVRNGSIIALDDYHHGDADPYNQSSAEMHREAAVQYVQKHYEIPDLVKLSELIDGAQKIRGIELATQHNVLTNTQKQRAVNAIEKDKSISPSRKAEYYKELLNIAIEGTPRADLDEQIESLLHSRLGDFVRTTLENGKDVIYATGDHAGRTVGHTGDEGRKFRAGYSQAYYLDKKGNAFRLSDNIFVGSGSQITNFVSYKGRNNLEGLSIFGTHKMAKDAMANARGAGLEHKLILTAHGHHFEISNAGGQTIIQTHGMVPAYDYVIQKGLRAGIQGTTHIEVPKQSETLYKDAISIDYTNNKAFEEFDWFNKREQIRSELAKYIPPM